MNAMAETYYDVWLDLAARTSRPRFLAVLFDRAGVTLDHELIPPLVQIDFRGPIGVLELAELLEQNHPKVSRSLARLEELGLITRAPAAHDQRIKTATTTPKGRQIVEAINRGRRRLLDDVFADWSERDQATFARLSRRFADGMFALVESHHAPGGR
jgi:DNA-binding MarR family transcriptional regulator